DPGGRVLSFDRAHVLRYWDSATQRETQSVNLAARLSPITSWSFNHDRSLLALGTKSGVVAVFDTQSDKHRRLAEGLPALWDVESSGDGGTLASIHADSKARFWDPKSGKLLETITLRNSRLRSMALSPDGKTLVLADHPDNARVSVYWRGQAEP